MNYERYHPKQAEQVWVRKTEGCIVKLFRYPCCGAAKEGDLYLVKSMGKNSKINKHGVDVYVAVTDKSKLPEKWNENTYLGCRVNTKRNKHNKSQWECCKRDIFSEGCKQRYICCHADFHPDQEDEGCERGWGC